jgi:hypothetical protein
MSGLESAIREFFSRFSVFKRPDTIDSAIRFGEFLATRSAFVSQKKLFEYVKTRMGLSYPRHFRDDNFIESLNIAKWHVYAAAMSDLAIWMAAQVYNRTGDGDETGEIARYWYSQVLHDRFDATIAEALPRIESDFASRVELTDWDFKGKGDHAFALSPKELVRWAPISDELKRYDVEIVENSIRFAWVAIRTDFNTAYDHDSFIADWRGNYAPEKNIVSR